MKRILLIAVLGVAVIASALGVVYAKHQSRKLFVQLTELQQQRDEMNIEWGQLQLEQSTWATHGRIEQKAQQRLKMKNMDVSQVVMLKP